MAFKKPTAQVTAPSSPDRLFGDLPRRKHPSLYDHQGQVLRNYVSEALNEPDVALQLPTGSGKTLVGLLLAEWRRRKFNERVVYLCPTKQLVFQTVQEAEEKYGLSVEGFTGSTRNYTPEAKAAYRNGSRVAITTYNSLFNTNPFFSDPDVVIIDDAHAAENYVASQWTLRIRRFEDAESALFNATASVIKKVIPNQHFARMVGQSQSISDELWVDKVPAYLLLEILDELHSTISANVVSGTDQAFAWSMLCDHLSACQLYISSAEVLLRPLIPPTWSHRPIRGAKQRIFMSATLGAGGDLERLTGRPKIKRLPIPEGWDRQGIGRRFFVFPEQSLNDDETVELRRSLASLAGRSLFLAPNQKQADAIGQDFEKEIGFRVFSARDIENGKEAFTSSPQAVTVVANRYDGIDFPGDDCRLLFVEGLPRATNLQERFLMDRMGASLLFNERLQTRVLQAVGRCTRGLNDYSAVVVTGDDLAAYLSDLKRRKYFHPELQAELEFGVEQSTTVPATEILDNFDIFMKHDEEWENANQAILDARETASQQPFPAMDQLASAVEHEISWQKHMWNADYVNAFESARSVLAQLIDEQLQGYRALWHYLAGAAAEMASREGRCGFETQARNHYQRAKSAASTISWLCRLSRGGDNADLEAEFDHRVMLQVENLEAELARLGVQHNRKFEAAEREIRDLLQTGEQFEQGQLKLGRHLGFEAGKEETDAAPDPWWIVGDIVIVFEDHANALAGATIDAKKARQAATHPAWIREHVAEAADAKILSVLVTPATQARSGAIPHLSEVGYWSVDEFRTWAEAALHTVRELRRTFNQPGDLVWRAEAAVKLSEARADGPQLFGWLSGRSARDHLIEVR